MDLDFRHVGDTVGELDFLFSVVKGQSGLLHGQKMACVSLRSSSSSFISVSVFSQNMMDLVVTSAEET